MQGLHDIANGARIIVVAGEPTAGTAFLFNATRALLRAHTSDQPWIVVKADQFDPHLAQHAHAILFCDSNRSLGHDRRWLERAAFVLRAELMLADPDDVVAELARVLAGEP